MWNERYSVKEYVYGKEPNQFLVQAAKYVKPTSTILSIGEGEGRNAVFLAGLGHKVSAIDSSGVGLQKARALAEEKNVKINTVEADLNDFNFGEEKWDAVVSIFCHIPSELRIKVHQKITEALKPGGIFILESYSKDQLNYTSGGPKTDDMLIDLNTTKLELDGLEFILAEEKVREIVEGAFHTGDGSVIQIIGRKGSSES